MTQLKDGGRQPSNREERPLSASTVIARGQGNGEPCKSRGLRTVLWAAGGEIPPADPAPASGWERHPKRDLGRRRCRVLLPALSATLRNGVVALETLLILGGGFCFVAHVSLPR